MVARAGRAATLVATALAFAAGDASAGARSRPLFEPTDLELEEAGVVQLDTQFGMMRSADGPSRLIVPDVELDIGLARNVELDIDASYAIEGPDAGPFALDHAAPDNVWVAAKVGLLDVRNLAAHTAWALGVQLGPKLPVAHGTSRLGAEGLLLVGRTMGRAHLVLNVGGLVDPYVEDTGRARGYEAGLDFAVDLDAQGTWSLLAELGGVRFVSDDASQLHATLGASVSATEWLDLSATGLVGLLEGGDRLGLLFGVSPKLATLR